jgi:aminoglycoside phosphotransferase (APT) family kinase protein
VTEDALLASYLEVIGWHGDAIGAGGAELRRGQFHDVLLLGEVAYRFPRDEQSRRLLPGRVALLRTLGKRELPVVIAEVVSDAALDQPLGRCHVALRRVPGRPIETDAVTGPEAGSAVADQLALLLDRLSELGADRDVQAAAAPADSQRWERFTADVAQVLFPLMSGDGRKRATAELARVQNVDATGSALVHSDLGGENLLWEASGPRPVLTAVLDWDGAHLGNQAEDVASIAATFGWPLATRLDARRHAGATPTIHDARAIAATFALQQALPAALSGDAEALDDGLLYYREQR